jgi:hypothetical protein
LLKVARNPDGKTFSQTTIGQQCFRQTVRTGYRGHNVVIPQAALPIPDLAPVTRVVRQ